jgi:hypothetical protein
MNSKHIIAFLLLLGTILVGCKKEEKEECCTAYFGEPEDEISLRVCEFDADSTGSFQWQIFMPPGSDWEDYKELVLSREEGGFCE